MARDTTPPGESSADRQPDIRAVDPGSVHVLYEPRATRVVLTGEIDAELGPDLLEAAEDALSSGRPVQVDAHHVTFMDSTGLAFLARLASRSRGRRVTLIRPPAVVRFLIETTNIVQLLDVVDEEPSLAQHGDPGPEPA
ncbi:anti-anti-sigma factor [Kineococcus xinjiangensis]|uniref:Anti-anti-sigma factor n=1 Tax=Kineococcus xinjiangensis TaxID=512762 RepID=A0A2S6IUH6_9ACTN|nr:STAS domain-containing protein [Kineococcus xinjiangensis]PPK97925.1 anti-anti-sigma factor [Kineococcus xinjiangensis]